MNYRDFEKNLTDGFMPSVLLFEGEEDYLKQKALQALRKKLLPEGLEDMNEVILDAPEADQIISAAETLPFLADRRLILIRDHPALTGRAEAEEALLEYLPKTPSSSVVLFYCLQKPDGRKKLYTAVKKLGGIVSFDRMKDRELTSFIVRSFADLSRPCDERTADLLAFISGSDATLLTSEIRKIASSGADGTPVAAEEVRQLATPSTESKVFEMTDAVASGQGPRAFSLLHDQLLSGADRVYLLSMLLRHFRILQHIKIMQYEKKPKGFMLSALGIPSFALDQYMRQAAMFTGGQVKRCSRLCFDTEYQIKSGALNAEGALEAVMLKLLLERKKD